MVEDEAEVGLELVGQLLGAEQADLLGCREEQLEPDGRGGRPVAAGDREQDRHGSLVVGAEDAVVAVGEAAVLA